MHINQKKNPKKQTKNQSEYIIKLYEDVQKISTCDEEGVTFDNM